MSEFTRCPDCSALLASWQVHPVCDPPAAVRVVTPFVRPRRQSIKAMAREGEESRLRDAVKHRCGLRCETCGTYLGYAGGHVHHTALRRRLSRELASAPELQTYLCQRCHDRAHADADYLDGLMRSAVERLTHTPCTGDPMEVLRAIERGEEVA